MAYLMCAKKTAQQYFGNDAWEILIDDRLMLFYLDERGVHAKQLDGKVLHADDFVSYQDLVAKAEKQLTLL